MVRVFAMGLRLQKGTIMIEYRVRPITRYVVTRFESGENSVGSSTRGEYDNERTAYDVAYALCKAEHERLGFPLDSMEIIYPSRLDEAEPIKDC